MSLPQRLEPARRTAASSRSFYRDRCHDRRSCLRLLAVHCALIGIAGSIIGRTSSTAQGQASKGRVFHLRIEDREIAGGETVIRVEQGDAVEMVWSSDEPVALHLHGYDLETSVKPGESAAMAFEAFATGRFPITSHGFGEESSGHGHSHETLIYLEVHPR